VVGGADLGGVFSTYSKPKAKRWVPNKKNRKKLAAAGFVLVVVVVVVLA